MTNIKLIKDILLETNSQIIFLEDAFDEALIGNSKNYNKEYVAVYDSTKYLKILIKKFNMNMIEAFEHLNSYIDSYSCFENKPIFFNDFSKAKEPSY